MEELVEFGYAADVNQRRGQEAADTEVNNQAALDDLDYRALDSFAGLGGCLYAAPRFFEARALLGNDQTAFLILFREDQHVDLFTQLNLFAGIDVLTNRKLGRGDYSLALEADINEYFVFVDLDYAAGDDLTFIECREGCCVVRDDLPVDLKQHPVASGNNMRFNVDFRGLVGRCGCL